MTIPLLLVKSPGVTNDALSTLRGSRLVQVYCARELGAAAVPFSARTARATIVATVRDPLEELVFARTSGFLGPLVVLTHQKFSTLRGEIRAAGALDSFLLPIDNARLDQLLALIETLPSPLVAFHQLGLLLDVVDHTIHHRGHSARLSQREFAILHCLVWSEGRPVRFDAIHAYVWGTQRHPSAMREIIDVNVSSLRKKLKRIGLPSAIRTFREFGYGLSDGVER